MPEQNEQFEVNDNQQGQNTDVDLSLGVPETSLENRGELLQEYEMSQEEAHPEFSSEVDEVEEVTSESLSELRQEVVSSKEVVGREAVKEQVQYTVTKYWLDNTEVDNNDVPLDLVLAIISAESAGGTVIANSALDVSDNMLSQGWSPEGDKFSLAKGPSQIIPSTGRQDIGLRVMYSADELSYDYRFKGFDNDYDFGVIEFEGEKFTLNENGFWSNGTVEYPVVDERMNVTKAIDGTIRFLNMRYKQASKRFPGDQKRIYQEVASYYNSGRGLEDDFGNDTEIQKQNYVNKVLESLDPSRAVELRDYVIEYADLRYEKVRVNVDRAIDDPIKIGQIVNNTGIPLDQFLNDNLDLSFRYPLAGVGPIQVDRQTYRKAKGYTDENGNEVKGRFAKIWQPLDFKEEDGKYYIIPKKVENSEEIKNYRLALSTKDRDEYFFAEFDNEFQFSFQDLFDLGIPPSKVIELNPQLNLDQILNTNIPPDHDIVVPVYYAEIAKYVVNSEIIEERLTPQDDMKFKAEEFIRTFSGEYLLSGSTDYKKQLADVQKGLESVGMGSSDLGNLTRDLMNAQPRRALAIELANKPRHAITVLKVLLNSIDLNHSDAKSYNQAIGTLVLLDSLSATDEAAYRELMTDYSERIISLKKYVVTSAGKIEEVQSLEDAYKDAWKEGNYAVSAQLMAERNKRETRSLELGFDKELRSKAENTVKRLEALLVGTHPEVYAVRNSLDSLLPPAVSFSDQEQVAIGAIEIENKLPQYEPGVYTLPISILGKSASQLQVRIPEFKKDEEFAIATLTNSSGSLYYNFKIDRQGAIDFADTFELADGIKKLVFEDVKNTYEKELFGTTLSVNQKVESPSDKSLLIVKTSNDEYQLEDKDGFVIRFFVFDPFDLRWRSKNSEVSKLELISSTEELLQKFK